MVFYGCTRKWQKQYYRGILKNYAHKYDKFETLEINSEDLSDLPNIF